MSFSAPLRVPPLVVAEMCAFSPDISAICCFEPMSWPEEKSGPVPPRMTTRTWSSASASRNASLRSTRSFRLSAFRLSGRFSMIRAIVPSSNVS